MAMAQIFVQEIKSRVYILLPNYRINNLNLT